MQTWLSPPAWAPPLSQRPGILWDPHGPHSAAELEDAADRVARALLERFDSSDLSEHRVAYLIPPSAEYVAVQWGVWRAGGVTVPLCTTHPLPELEHTIRDSQSSAVIYDRAAFGELMATLADRLSEVPFLELDELLSSMQASRSLPEVALERRAQILYTSGTTGKPKGAVTTHANLLAQVQVLLEEWGWKPCDFALHVLPLHHTHGIINVLCCGLAAGASIELFQKFDARLIWERFCTGRDGKLPTVFMAVPTIYSKLIEAHAHASRSDQKWYSEAARRLRLMVSGSAALPVPVLEKWREITGHTLLERYGMTEIGMALSNPLQGERRPGTVGKPLPGSEVRLQEGEIQVRGPSVFLEYFGRPEATAESFTPDGYFKTGDAGEVSDDGYWKILGRNSIDILKTGGYKVSALEIEAELRLHPAVSDACIVGVPDQEWGERVAAAVILREGGSLESLEPWLRERLATYKVPRLWKAVSEFPRNAMGKVTKKDVLGWFYPPSNTRS
jgi:malonyl-CoA/methylmalonyl-CoA synthetase